MALTAKGETLLSHVSLGFEHIILALNKIQNEPLEGLLKVSAPPSFASRWLLPRLWKFSLDHPGIPIRIITTCESLDIQHGEIDVAIWQGEQFEKTDGIEQEVLLEEAIYPYCSPELAKAEQFTEPSQMLDCWLIHFDSCSIQWNNWFKQAGVTIDKQAVQWMEVGTFDMAMSAVIAGHGACLASDCITADFIERGLLVKPFDLPLSPGIRFHLCTATESARRERVQTFTQWLKKEVAENTSQAPLPEQAR
ncbi:transcriptional regulator [Vibrio ponticus]|nr:transcriptional regulator [Vibrio ponticus]